jgi:hypothetical protein
MKARSSYFSRHTSILIVLLIICIASESCSTRTPTTSITGSWKDPEGKNYKDFLVAVLSKNLPARSTFEGDIAKRLKHEGVKASESMLILGRDQKLESAEDKKAAVEKIQGLSYDAIITITLVKKTENSRYVAGTTSYAPTNIGIGTGYYDPATGLNQGSGSYGSFGTYYMSASTVYNTEGYYVTDKEYFVQSNMYDAKTAKLVWSAQSETFNPSNLAMASSDFSYVMTEAMKKANLIYKKTKK